MPVTSKDDANSSSRSYRMIEFFSGIGGMRFGVENALLSDDKEHVATTQQISNHSTSPLLSCKAYEISQYANSTYAHNFKDALIASTKKNPSKKRKRLKGKESGDVQEGGSTDTDSESPILFSVATKLVEQLKPKDMDGVADIWTMSPPCQPFTRTWNAKQRDSDDERCKGFKAIISLLKAIKDKPRFIMLENVKGFLGSHMLMLWQECLTECGYSWEEFLLSPMQLGIPNHRTRYYMVCERSDRFSSQVREKEDMELSQLPTPCVNNASTNTEGETTKSEVEVSTVSSYTSDLDKQDVGKYLIPDAVLKKKWAKDLPVVSVFDKVTHCFTSGYCRQLHKSTGSLLLLETDRSKSVVEEPIDRSDMSKYKGKLRRFTPIELLKIFGFPSDDFFPADMSLTHQYKLVGNSVNVNVVTCLAKYLLKDV
mmetsp:Transcript_23947/g.36467  ORF Transcript_23947/g.36467 Transcript_23947/m.36467 type:complete len:426 (+) Transcript_23947:46-1323(+)